jgi:chemotaxis receptor (MCP) glutamine deamidase CheD
MFSEFVKKGISIKSLKSKVYGGNITMINNENNTGNDNIKFIFDFLTAEGIPVMENVCFLLHHCYVNFVNK